MTGDLRRIRTRLAAFGVEGLSTGDMLGLILQAGMAADGAVDTANTLLVRHGGLAGLAGATDEELADPGLLPPSAIAAFRAALELGRRRLQDHGPEPRLVRTSADIGPDLVLALGPLEQETLWVVLLNVRGVVLGTHQVYQGCVATLPLRTGEVFRLAIRRNATALIVAHNHPSGDPTPSPEDVARTRDLVQAGALLDVEVLDHLIVGGQRYISLRERRLGFDGHARKEKGGGQW